MKKLSVFLLTMILAIFTAACGSTTTSEKTTTSEAPKTETQEEITITHALGETKVKKNPQKVVVFDFGTLDTFDKLGIEVTGLPKDNVPTYLSQYDDDKYQNAGGLMEPDMEAISEIAPDLIIISGRQADYYDKLSEIAPTISMSIDFANYMDSFKKNLNTIGELFDKQAEVEKELASVEETIASVNEAASATKEKSLVVLVNDGSLSAFGPNSRFGIIHDVFGLPAADENIEASIHGQSVTFEYVAETNPDYLFVVDRGAIVGGQSSAKSVLENELVNGTNAAKNGHIIYLNPEYWYASGGGLESMAAMANEIQEGLK